MSANNCYFRFLSFLSVLGWIYTVDTALKSKKFTNISFSSQLLLLLLFYNILTPFVSRGPRSGVKNNNKDSGKLTKANGTSGNLLDFSKEAILTQAESIFFAEELLPPRDDYIPRSPVHLTESAPKYTRENTRKKQNKTKTKNKTKQKQKQKTNKQKN